MTSGIYKLTFKDGSFYIGKSSNIEKRWKQHAKGLAEGTHTKKMQEAFNKCGEPKYEVLFTAHSDHIDILETLFILSNWNSRILNTTKPSMREGETYATVPAEYWKMSTQEHIERLMRASTPAIPSNTEKELRIKLAKAYAEIEKLKSTTRSSFWMRVADIFK